MTAILTRLLFICAKFKFLRRNLIFVSLLLAGCASISHTGSYQAVLVQSKPPGATIIIDGEDAGHTPKYVMVRRGRHPEVMLKTAKGPLLVPLASQYRWSDSFFSGLVFLTGAPYAWAIDLLTGTAWDAADPAPPELQLSSDDLAASKLPSKKVTAIAPPRSDSLAISDSGGAVLYEALSKQNAKVTRAYSDTIETFAANNYDYDSAPAEDQRRLLYRELGVDSIYESSIETKNDGLILTAQERDVVSHGLISQPLRLKIEPNGDLERAYLKRDWWYRLLPNTYGMDFVNEKLTVSRGTESYEFVNSDDQAWWATGLQYLSAINATYMPARRSGRAPHLSLSLIPAFRASRRQVKVRGLPASSDGPDQLYVRWWLSGGYGPELGFQVGKHFLYLNLIPLLFWDEISWSQSSKQHSRTGQGIQLQAEFGYVYFMNPSWSLRLFARSLAEDSEGWQEALSSRLPSSPTAQTLSASTAMAGLSIGYRFEPRFESGRWSQIKSIEKN